MEWTPESPRRYANPPGKPRGGKALGALKDKAVCMTYIEQRRVQDDDARYEWIVVCVSELLVRTYL